MLILVLVSAAQAMIMNALKCVIHDICMLNIINTD